MQMAMVYLFLMVIFWLIGVAILRWMLRINKIVQELELIRKALMTAHNLESVYKIPDKELVKEVEKISKSEIDKGWGALQKTKEK
jgi:hypothetical protein